MMLVDLLYLFPYLLSAVFFILGLAQLLGLGWALFLFDLILQNSPSEYYFAQKSHKRGKGLKNRILGIILIIISIVIVLIISIT